MTTLLSAVFMLMAPLPARYLRLSFGRTAYWAFTLLSSVALFFVLPHWAFSQFILLLLVGLFTDFEQGKFPLFYSAFASIGISCLSFFFILSVWAREHKTTLVQLLRDYIGEIILTSQRLQRFPVELNADMVLGIFPSLVAFLFMALVCISVLFVRPQERKEKATVFRAPDSVIWVFIAALAGTFLLSPEKYFLWQKAASNLLYVCMGIYYFQGLAVAGFFLAKARLNYFLKAGLFFILSVHLFIFMAVLGLSDVWFSYRSKWYKNALKDSQ